MSEHTNDESTAADRIGEVTVRRYIHHQFDVLVAQGDFVKLIDAYKDHVRRWQNEIDGLSLVMMSQGLGAATLHLSCRPPGESIGWTINIQEPPTNIFITGDSREMTVTGRAFTENVRVADSNRMFVQISRRGEPPIQSTVNVSGLDIFMIFEQYYEMSEQTPARFFEITDHDYMMILGLPEVDRDWLNALSRDEALELGRTGPDVDGQDECSLRSLGQATYALRCGCNPARIIELMVTIYRDDPEDLFRGDTEVEAMCPRCGRRWAIQREEFDARHAAGDDDPVEDAGEDRAPSTGPAGPLVPPSDEAPDEPPTEPPSGA